MRAYVRKMLSYTNAYMVRVISTAVAGGGRVCGALRTGGGGLAPPPVRTYLRVNCVPGYILS